MNETRYAKATLEYSTILKIKKELLLSKTDAQLHPS